MVHSTDHCRSRLVPFYYYSQRAALMRRVHWYLVAATGRWANVQQRQGYSRGGEFKNFVESTLQYKKSHFTPFLPQKDHDRPTKRKISHFFSVVFRNERKALCAMFLCCRSVCKKNAYCKRIFSFEHLCVYERVGFR